MKKTIALLFCLSFTAADALRAADSTAALLDSHRVAGVIRVRANGKVMQYQIDGNGLYRDLDVVDGFVSTGQIQIAYPDFNPFLVHVDSEVTETKNVNFAAIADFLDKIKSTADELGVKSVNMSMAKAFVQAESTCRAAAPAAGDCPKDERRLNDCIRDLHTAMREPIVSADVLSGWSKKSTSAANVIEVRGDIDSRATAIDTLLKNLDNLREYIRKTFIADALPGEKSCPVRPSTLAMLLDITQGAADEVTAKKVLRGELKTLYTSLEPFTNGNNWEGTSYLFRAVKPTFENDQNVAVTIRQRKFDPQPTGELKFEETEPVKATLPIRFYSPIVPEVGAALIYSELKYPKYGTAKKEGVTVVKRGADESFPVEGALMLNWLVRSWNTGFGAPGLQLGVSTAKDYPGFLGGVTFRFTRPRAFSIMAGKMITWYRDLHTLKENDPVDGTEVIESDLVRRRSPAAWYFGIQYTFK